VATLSDMGKTEQFFRPQYGISRPGLFLHLVGGIIDFQFGVGGKNLRTLEVVEMGGDLFGKEPADFRYAANSESRSVVITKLKSFTLIR
jgi:hypothetical protein